ncbi:MAG: hypothetical protein COW18_03925 [Zetaproteobacteria bacterium CG12_big_fil_rev_8_21_14_0_65_54_13]|nr:MAG: hypothetical protein COW18_03925 [Zetaproteobacteria bacterium CG12_big_fil_rev_8_21_14_0_65_54_13]PIX54757.1 MAG: hypothetical protein COZ50_06125 [Zetaproteobacteria bacterium CG_4_10_14_3_um_filter_54_28]PJA29687.1 MAG: hypothetical protein CO188_06195 [Zetaproteobacteria bacterium CG_4_9_14_3_um_filter_54_145]
MHNNVPALHRQRKLVHDSIESMQREGESMHALSSKFYTRLLQTDPTLGDIFDGSPVTLNRKFSNMIATFKNLKHLEMITPAIESLSKRHLAYGMQPAHLDSFKAALIFALEKQLRDRFTDELKQAWNNCYDDVAVVIRRAAKAHPELFRAASPKQHTHYDMNLLADIGGADVVKQVLARFYGIIFADAWLGQFFYGKSKTGLTNKQSKFMVAAFGGPNTYEGEPPALSHMHMYITEEISLLREKMLRQAISDQGLGIDIAERWLSVDRSFWHSIHKQSVDECVTKCFGQAPVVVKKPENYQPQ